MKFSQEEITNARDKFYRKRTLALVLTVPLVLLAIFFAFGREAPILGLSSEIWLGLFFVVLIPAYLNWRCPNCGVYLGRRSFSPRHCSKCGIPLAGD